MILTSCLNPGKLICSCTFIEQISVMLTIGVSMSHYSSQKVCVNVLTTEWAHHFHSSPPLTFTSCMQMKRGTMAWVDILPSAYLNFRVTKACVDLLSNTRPKWENGSTESQNNNCLPLWRHKCLFSCPLTWYYRYSFACRMLKKIF